ncbi:MAG: hypothetical protein JNL01_03315 [Bdellovibrionales bacterium]|nr:hypothetical protein [Bdellovibrionales bacterium]
MSALLLSSSVTFAANDYPDTPDSRLTPGALCKSGSEIRYPEKIRYCSRNVSSATKANVMSAYDSQLGFQVNNRDRREFKIDHYIPLCAGGSNDASNLWPQHESIYKNTDPLESLVCQKMSDGKLLQKDAVAFIKKAKADPYRAYVIISQVQAL